MLKLEKLISSKTVFTCPIFRVDEAVVKMGNEKFKRWYVVRNDAVAVICVDRERKEFIMIRDYRSAYGAFVWWVPAGGMEDGETPREAAVRETREEVGLEPLRMKLLTSFENPSSVVRQTTHLFIADKFRKNPLPGDKGEKYTIKIRRVPFSRINRIIDDPLTPDWFKDGIRKILKGKK